MLNDYNANGPWPSLVMDRNDNVAWGTAGWKLYQTGTNAFYPDGGSNQTITKATEDPLAVCDFANGRFAAAPAYADFGSTLE